MGGRRRAVDGSAAEPIDDGRDEAGVVVVGVGKDVDEDAPATGFHEDRRAANPERLLGTLI
jgi:hypothetical protein